MNGNHAGYSLLSALPHPYTLPVFQGLSPNFQMVPGGSMNPACPMDFLAPLPLLFSSTLRAMGLPPLLSQCGELTEPLPPSLAGSTAVEIPQPNFQFEQPSLSSSPFRRADSRSQRMGGKWPLLRHEEASFTSSSCTEGSGEANVVDIEADWSTTESCFHETSLPERRRRMAMEGGRTEKGGAGDQVKTVEETSGSMHDTTVAKRRLEGESLSSSEAKRYRTTYSAYQTKVLEGMFEEERYISRPQRAQLAAQLQLPENTIKVWFQNRRMKEKRMSLMLPNFANSDPLLRETLLQVARLYYNHQKSADKDCDSSSPSAAMNIPTNLSESCTSLLPKSSGSQELTTKISTPPLVRPELQGSSPLNRDDAHLSDITPPRTHLGVANEQPKNQITPNLSHKLRLEPPSVLCSPHFSRTVSTERTAVGAHEECPGTFDSPVDFRVTERIATSQHPREGCVSINHKTPPMVVAEYIHWSSLIQRNRHLLMAHGSGTFGDSPYMGDVCDPTKSSLNGANVNHQCQISDGCHERGYISKYREAGTPVSSTIFRPF